MFTFENAEFRYEPYPIGAIAPIMASDVYEQLVDSFPPVELFDYMPEVGHKYTLSEKFKPANYHDYIAKTPVWRELHAWIKSERFFDGVIAMLGAHDIDLGLGKAKFTGKGIWPWRLGEMMKGRWPRGDLSFRPRFEFSMLPADGGYVTPHTDTPRKIITLVVSMVKPGEWNPEFGGGTEVDRPKSDCHAFNRMNRYIPFEDAEALHTFDFKPNQCVIFIKTFNSLPCVRPMAGTGRPALRHTLPIPIEKQE